MTRSRRPHRPSDRPPSSPDYSATTSTQPIHVTSPACNILTGSDDTENRWLLKTSRSQLERIHAVLDLPLTPEIHEAMPPPEQRPPGTASASMSTTSATPSHSLTSCKAPPQPTVGAAATLGSLRTADGGASTRSRPLRLIRRLPGVHRERGGTCHIRSEGHERRAIPSRSAPRTTRSIVLCMTCGQPMISLGMNEAGQHNPGVSRGS